MRDNLRHWPPIVFASAFFLLCYVGVVYILLAPKWMTYYFHYFSGATVPALDSAQVWTLVALLHLPVALWVAGYYLGFRFPLPQRTAPAINKLFSGVRLPLALSVWAISMSVAYVSLLRGGAVNSIGSWLDYGSWVHMRWQLFATLGFFEFVNLYVWVPLSTTLVSLQLLKRQATGSMRWSAIAAVVLPALATQVLLFQKKQLIVALIVLFGAYLIQKSRESGLVRVRRPLILSLLLLYAAFQATVITPIMLNTSNAIGHSTKSPLQTLSERFVSVSIYAILAPVTRGSAPAIAYPYVFPTHHEYYGLDWGQDVLGYGSMPDDNLVVWNYVYPNVPGGSVVVPSPFVWYSQAGLVGACIAAFVVGLIVSLLWRLLVLLPGGQSAMSALAGSTLILYCVLLAMDSWRNATLVSYGLIWALLWALVVVGLSLALRWELFARAKKVLAEPAK